MKTRKLSIVIALVFLLVFVAPFSITIPAKGEDVHDLRVSLEAGLAHLKSGNSRILNATVYNDGDVTENTVHLELFINGSIKVDSMIAELPRNGTYTSGYYWKPTVDGVYNVTAYAPPVNSESYIANNIGTKWVNVCTNKPPIANFTVSPEKQVAMENVTFNASASYDPDWGNITEYKWNFGDNYIITTNSPVITHKYSYTTPYRRYNVTLTLRDTENLNDSTSQNIKIYARPKADYVIKDYPGPYRVNEPITFDASKSDDPDGKNITNYGLDFKDGTYFNTTNSTIMHNYTLVGTYQPTLYVTDNDGLTDELTSWIIEVISSTHDVAVTNITLLRDVIHGSKNGGRCIGTPDINVTVRNQGTFLETFNVTAYGTNTTVVTIGKQTVTLDMGQSKILQFDWNTTGIPPGNYTISASAALAGDADPSDNSLSDGIIDVRLAGDVQVPPDNVVDGVDAVITIDAIPSYPGHPRWNRYADINCDEVVDGQDIVIIIDHIPSHWP